MIITFGKHKGEDGTFYIEERFNKHYGKVIKRHFVKDSDKKRIDQSNKIIKIMTDNQESDKQEIKDISNKDNSEPWKLYPFETIIDEPMQLMYQFCPIPSRLNELDVDGFIQMLKTKYSGIINRKRLFAYGNEVTIDLIRDCSKFAFSVEKIDPEKP